MTAPSETSRSRREEKSSALHRWLIMGKLRRGAASKYAVAELSENGSEHNITGGRNNRTDQIQEECGYCV